MKRRYSWTHDDDRGGWDLIAFGRNFRIFDDLDRVTRERIFYVIEWFELSKEKILTMKEYQELCKVTRLECTVDECSGEMRIDNTYRYRIFFREGYAQYTMQKKERYILHSARLDVLKDEADGYLENLDPQLNLF